MPETLSRLFLLLAGLSGAMAVAAGAFAAHGLPPLRGDYTVTLWRTGSHYQMVHALALMLAVLLSRSQDGAGRLLMLSGGAFATGLVLFPGALYALGWWGPSWLGAVAPLGGGALILGWLLLALAGLRRWP